MSYDLGTKPDREAGPIERVVLQEGLDEDEEYVDAEDGGGSRGGGDGGEDREGRGDGDDGMPDMSEEGRGEVGGGGGSSSPGPSGTGNRSAVDAMAEAEAEAEVVDVSPEVGAMEAGDDGGEPAPAGKERGTGADDRQDFRAGAEVVTGPEGLDYDSSTAKTMQQYQEGYWGKGYQAGGGGLSGGGGGGGSGRGGWWGSPTRPSMAPRLSVDLINVDPVKELVKTVRGLSCLLSCSCVPYFLEPILVFLSIYSRSICLSIGRLS